MNNCDVRLVPAYRLIDSGTLHVLSIDIFDTLLWRMVPKPNDLFLLLGKKLEQEGWLVPGVGAENFAYLRSVAEAMAHERKKAAHEENSEVTLEEAYWTCSGIFRKISVDEMIAGVKGIINESDVQELVSLEVALEKQLTAFDENIVQLIKYASERQVKVILISDTYFTLSQLHEILERGSTPILKMISKIYPSCEYGCHKHAGLFTKVLKDFKMSPQTALHVGDHRVSDCLAAEAAGIASIHYEKYDTALKEVITREWPEENITKRMKQLDPTFGDFGFTALRSRVIHATELQKFKKSDQFFWKYGASILGPVLTGFTHWLYQRCEALQVPRVFCLMREGRLYAQLINEYAKFYPQFSIQTEELWLSRTLTMRACVVYGTEEELKALLQIHSFAPYTVESFAKAVGVSVSQLGRMQKYRNLYLEKLEMAGELMHYMAHTPSVKNTMIQYSAALRQRILRYLSKFLDLSTTREITLVDIGWAGTIQGALQAILTLAGYKISVQGLYLGTTLRAYYALMQGMMREGYLIQGGFPQEMEHAIRGGLLILEQTATTGLNTLKDIDDAGNIVLQNVKLPKSQIRESELVRQGIDYFLNYYGKQLRDDVVQLNPNSDAFKEQLRTIMMRSMSYPTQQEAQHLGNWFFDHRTGVKKMHSIGHDPYYEKYVQAMPAGMFKDFKMAWPAAYAAKVDKFGTLAAQAVRMGVLPKECFLSHDSKPLRVFLDTGTGFPKKANKLVDVHNNANGGFYSYMHLTSKKIIRKVRLEAPENSIRIKSLRLTLHTFDSTEAQTRIYFEDDQEGDFPLTYDFENEKVYSVQIRVVGELRR